MPTLSLPDFLTLLERSESDTLDFKKVAYDLSSEHSKSDLIKDVVCMANTPREGVAHIVLGVKKHPDGTHELTGLDKHLDDADLQSQFRDRVHPIPEFTYETLKHDEMIFGIITIPLQHTGPCAVIKNIGHQLQQGLIYFRRNSQNDFARPEDLKKIFDWFRNKDVLPHQPESAPTWHAFLNAAHNFNPAYRFILITPRIEPASTLNLEALGRIPWSAVLDFDPASESNGLLKEVRSSIERTRSLHIVVSKDRPNINSQQSTYWFFARGLEGRGTTLSKGPWKDWVRQYKSEISDQLKRIASALLPNPIILVLLDYENTIGQQLRTTLEECLGIFGEHAELLIATDDPTRFRATANDFDAELVNIPLSQLCSGCDSIFDTHAATASATSALPSSSGAPISLNEGDKHWLEEELNILYLHTGLAPPDPTPASTFIRGAEVDWYELNTHADVDRDKTMWIHDRVDTELKARRTARVNLYHLPGAGGTTVGRRLLWNFHWRHACAVLRRTHPTETAERLFKITSLTAHGVLLLVDGGDIPEQKVDELYDRLRSRHIPVVMLQVLRRFSAQTEGSRAFNLISQLSPAEASRFATKYSAEMPSKRALLLNLANARSREKCTPFYFGLEAFGAGFLGLQSHVQVRLSGLQEIQRRIVGFLAIAHHYGQRTLPSQSFAGLLGIPANRLVDLRKALPEQTIDLLIEGPSGAWRTAHDILATEILQQLLTPTGTDKRLWKQQLSDWGSKFIEFCRGNSSVASEEMLEAVRRVFIFRDNSEMLGTEKAGTNRFAQIIEDIPSSEGGAGVLRRLTTYFPEETHFWAHLGRYLSARLHDFKGALECINQALTQEDDDHVLHHMKGMALRSHIYDLIANKASLAEITEFATQASEAFAHARELAPDDEHGHISEVQMITRVVNYAGQTQSKPPLEYLSSQGADPFLRESLSRAEDLLENVRRNREGDPASQYEENCRASLDALYGNTEKALQRWDNLLARKDVYAPPVRRQIVWTYLARRKRFWDELPASEITRAVQLLEENLREEPNKDDNLKLWIQAARRQRNSPNLESIIERVGYWRTTANSLDSVYYLYILHSLQVFDSSKLDYQPALRFLGECKAMAQFRRNRTMSTEWLGVGIGIGRLVHYSLLGNWSSETDFWESTERLTRVRGRIARIDAPQAGQLELDCGLPAFFVPARGGYSVGRSENKLITCYIGFSYDSIRAWEVRDAD